MDMLFDGHRWKFEPAVPRDSERCASVSRPSSCAGRHPARLSLALQGGGSFGAFTWGVLDRLLEEEDLELDTVSGASAGAMNAIVLAAGLEAGGPAEARVRLDRFWHHLATSSSLPTALSALPAATLLSPYLTNPLDLNPLRWAVDEEVDFERLRANPPFRMLIAATNVKDGRLRLFRENEVTTNVILASACLPHIHRAVEIDGEAYWDGGFSANPPLRQLALDGDARDVLLVQIMPEETAEVPHLSADISRRSSAIAFNASLHRELQGWTICDRAAVASCCRHRFATNCSGCACTPSPRQRSSRAWSARAC
jgi:NTE family protein